MEFKPFPKLSRLSRACTVTEKIDGTNSQIYIENKALVEVTIPPALALMGDLVMFAGSRSRWINPLDDNFGFAKWAIENAEELFKLGAGQHFGEWWGSGIQRGYDLPKGEKRFSLFNTHRWADPEVRPKCCHVAPTLYQGLFDTVAIDLVLKKLRDEGSLASPGFMKPEGIVVYHAASGEMFKKTLDKNDEHKG